MKALDQKALQNEICQALLNAFPMDDKVADAHAAVAVKVIVSRMPVAWQYVTLDGRSGVTLIPKRAKQLTDEGATVCGLVPVAPALAVAEAVEPVAERRILGLMTARISADDPCVIELHLDQQASGRELVYLSHLITKNDNAWPASPPPASSPKVSEAQVERAARAIYALEPYGSSVIGDVDWDEIDRYPQAELVRERAIASARAALTTALSPDIQRNGALISHRMEEAGFVEFLNEDVPTIVRDIEEKVAIHLDLNTRKVVGYRVYDPASPSLTGEE